VFPEYELVIEPEMQEDVDNTAAAEEAKKEKKSNPKNDKKKEDASDHFVKEKELLRKYDEEMKKLSIKERENEDKAFREDAGLIRAFSGADAAQVRLEARQLAMEAKKKEDKQKINDNDDDEDEDTKNDNSGAGGPDLVFDRFQAFMRANPEQVIRYNRLAGKSSLPPKKNVSTQPEAAGGGGGAEGIISEAPQPSSTSSSSSSSPPPKTKRQQQQPLWISPKNQIDLENVPKCKYCGGQREFEFQIMPQLLNYLNIDHFEKDSLDWGIIACYTCSGSCGDGSKAYFEEFAHCQNIIDPEKIQSEKIQS